MNANHYGGGGEALEFTEDERLVVFYLRTLHLERDEAMRRLSTPLSPPLLPCGQELQANLQAVAEKPLVEESTGTEEGH